MKPKLRFMKYKYDYEEVVTSKRSVNHCGTHGITTAQHTELLQELNYES